MTDIDIIYKCNRVELDAIMEGLQYRQVAEREKLAELALNMRYTLNAKNVNVSKLKFDKQKVRIKRAYHKCTTSNASKFAQRIEALNRHFGGGD